MSKVNINDATILLPIIFHLTYYYKVKEHDAVDRVLDNTAMLFDVAGNVPENSDDPEKWFVKTVVKNLAGANKQLVQKTPSHKTMVGSMMRLRHYWPCLDNALIHAACSPGERKKLVHNIVKLVGKMDDYAEGSTN